jgi:H+/Cl- antiporter ClcA
MTVLTSILTLYAIQLLLTRLIHRRIIKLRGEYQENSIPYLIPVFGLTVMFAWWHYVAKDMKEKKPSRIKRWFQNKDLEDGTA